MNALVPVTLGAVLSVRVVSRGGSHTPRIAYLYVEQPDAHDMYAAEHALTALVWRASKGRGWDVRAVHGHDERGRLFAGAELELDQDGYEAAREGERLLESVRAQMEVR